MTTTPIQPMSDAELTCLDNVFGISEFGGTVTAATVKSRQYWALRERLRVAEAEVALARERLGPAGWKMLKELQAARAVCALVWKWRGGDSGVVEIDQAILQWRATKEQP